MAFEEHPHGSANNDDPETKNHEMHNLKKLEHDENVPESDIQVYHQEGSRELFDGHEHVTQDPRLTVRLDGSFDLDMANSVHITIERNTIPGIIVQLNPSEITHFEEEAKGRDWKMVVEIMFAERSHSSQN